MGVQSKSPLLTGATVKTAKRRLIEMHYRSRVGHLGSNLSCLEAMLLLHHEKMQPQDRFILSKGHSAGAYYITLWSKGLLPDAELDTFHRDDTRLAGHPPAQGIPEILFATGSLGHGLSLAAGLALTAKLKKQTHNVFCLTSDGEWQEGSTLEALIFAAHHKLNNLTILVDHNGLQGFGTTTEVASMYPLNEKLKGFDLHIKHCDGHDLNALRHTITPSENKPTIIIMNTHKGHGIAEMEDRMESHYLPLNEMQYQAALAKLGT